MTQVEIANAALILLGAGTIRSLNDQGNAESRKLSQVFRSAVEDVLRKSEFPAAIRRKKLTLYGDGRADISPYKYAYAVPPGCLILLSLTNASSQYQPIENSPIAGDPRVHAPLWVKEGDAYYTDVIDAVAKYTFYPDDLNILPQYVADVIAYELAYRTSTILGRDARVTAQLFEMARLKMKEARDNVGLEGAGPHTTARAWDARS